MRDFFRSGRFKLILTMFSAFSAIMLFSVYKGENPAVFDYTNKLFMPLRKLSCMISVKADSKLNVIANSEKYFEENQELKAENIRLYNMLVEYEQMKTELDELREYTGIKEKNPQLELSPPCNVIGRVTNDPFGAFILDKGESDGISPLDPVITQDGIIGVVSKTTENSSTVCTLLSPDVSVGGVCIRTKETGIIEGNAAFSSDGLCKMLYMDTKNSVSVGDVIITSGIGGRFPYGCLIGTVKEKCIEDSGLSAYAVIKPFADIETTERVCVITDFPKQALNEQ